MKKIPFQSGDVDGRLDEATASLMLDTRPSKVISNELIVSRLEYKLHKSPLPSRKQDIGLS